MTIRLKKTTKQVKQESPPLERVAHVIRKSYFLLIMMMVFVQIIGFHSFNLRHSTISFGETLSVKNASVDDDTTPFNDNVLLASGSNGDDEDKPSPKREDRAEKIDNRSDLAGEHNNDEVVSIAHATRFVVKSRDRKRENNDYSSSSILDTDVPPNPPPLTAISQYDPSSSICTNPNPSRTWPYIGYLPKNYTASYKFWNYSNHRISDNVMKSQYHDNHDGPKLTSFEILERIIDQTTNDTDDEASKKEILESCFKANLTRSYELVRKYSHCRPFDAIGEKKIEFEQASIGGPSYPVLNVGFPKIGSSSLLKFFTCAGYGRRAGHTTRGFCMKDIVDEGLSPLNPRCMNNRRVECQLDQYHIMPQMALLDEIHHSEPNATFILTFRPMKDWIRSAANHNNMRKRFDLRPQPGMLKSSNRNIPVISATYSKNNLPPKKELFDNHFSDDDIAMWFCRHIARVREFVKQHPSHDLIELDIYDSKSSGEILSSLFGGSPECWGQANANKKFQKPTNNETKK